MIRRQDPASRSDRAAVTAITLEAFGPEGSKVAELVTALQSGDAFGLGLSFLAERDGAAIGHTMLTRSWVDARRRLVEVLVLSPLSVALEHQRTGVGRALVTHALRAADDIGAPAVFLEGDPAYYGRLGFRPAGALGFGRPSVRIPEAACQVALLSAYEPWMTGALVYADRFWACDCVGLR